MKRKLLFALLPLTLLAQDATQKKEEPKKEETKKEESQPPAPAVEKALSGFIDIGYRWTSDVGGDRATYRSIVNTFEGVRLPAMQLDWVSEKSKVADEAHLQASNWGDPFNGARFNVGRRGIYEFNARYSNLFYYNYLPSFANPNLASGVYTPEVAYDTSVRNYDYELRLLPGHRISPYVGVLRNSSAGTGIMPLVLDNNEYPIRNNIRWSQDNIFGGARFEWSRWHATLEQGATRFRDDQFMYSTQSSTGNRTTPYLGQTLTLTNGQQAYGIRGDGLYSKVLLTANPTNWLDLYGQFLYSNPETTANYSRNATGTLYAGDPFFAFYTRNQDMLYGNAGQPHTSGYTGGEIRLGGNVRVRQTWSTDRYHTSSFANLTSLYSTSSTSQTVTSTEPDRMVVNNSYSLTEGLWDVSKWFTVRGGFRYDYGDTTVRSGLTSITQPFEQGELKRYVGLFGVTVRAWSKLLFSGDMERADAKKVYYLTSLADYTRLRTQVRYQVRNDLTIGGSFNFLYNKNAFSGLAYDARQTSIYAQWLPRGSKYLSVLADYTRSTIMSDINFLVPSSLQPAESLYKDNANTGTLLLDLKAKGEHSPHLTAGGSFVTTSGSRPSRYYQPIGRLTVPVTKHVQFFGEWRWYGFSQTFYLYEGFRNHQILTGLRLVM